MIIGEYEGTISTSLTEVCEEGYFYKIHLILWYSGIDQ